MKCTKILSTLVCCVFALLCVIPLLAHTKEEEENLGRDYARQVEQDTKLVEDKAIIERVERIGQTLAKIANEQEVPARYGSSNIFKFDYKFKVVQDKDVNAFSLPGGYIYVNSGLVEIVESDDELAGVLAHEIAHSSHHHMVQLIKKQSTVDRYIALITLAGILSNMRSRDLNNLLYGAQLVKTGKMSGYTMEAEKDADRAAVAYLAKSSYKPQGMLTFMKKLEAKHDANPSLPLGIFQDHPQPYRRVISIAKAMKDEGINIDLRQARDVAYAKPVPVGAGNDLYQVTIAKKVVYIPADLQADRSSKQRAETIAGVINKLLDSGVTCQDISEDSSGGSLLIKGKEVLKIEKADAALNGNDNRALLEKARSALEYAVWAEWLCERCPIVQQAESEPSD